MASKEFKTWCKIIDYVHATNPGLGAIMVGVCADMPLNAFKGKAGITFLMPQDKAFLSKLETLAYSDKVEESDMAGRMLNALIIRDVFRTPAEWKSREVSNSLYPPQIIDVDSTTATQVTFKSGAKAVIDEKFKDASRRANLSVWKLTGEIPVTTDKPAGKPVKQSAGKTGAYQPDTVHAQRLRYKIAIIVENEYAAACTNAHSTGNNGSTRCIYGEYSLSLVDFIINERKDLALALDKVIPMIAFDKMDFYFLVEPHKNGGKYLLDDDIIAEWWAWKDKNPCSTSAVASRVRSLMTGGANGSAAAVYGDRTKLFDVIAKTRSAVAPAIEARPRQSVEEVTRVYTELESANRIGAISSVYPTGLATYYASEPGLKMMHDELRYRAHCAFAKLEAFTFDRAAYHELVNLIGECLHAGTNERDSQRKLLNRTTVRSMISPSELIDEIKIFVYSTMFLQMPMLPAEAEALRQKYVTVRPDPSNLRVFNIAHLNFQRHERILSHDALRAGHALVVALRTVDLSALDPQIRDEIKAKFA